MRVDDDHRVDAIFVTLPAVVFDGLAGAKLGGNHRTVDLNCSISGSNEFQRFQMFQVKS